MAQQALLDCGIASPELYDDANKEAWHVFNMDFSGQEKRDRIVRFVCARLRHFQRHLPEHNSQRIRFDLRGQFVTSKVLKDTRDKLLAYAAKENIQLSVEYFKD